MFLGVALLGTGACGGDDPPPTSPQAAAEATPTPEPDPVCPLTGEDAKKVAALDRPAVAVKIENSPQARPQSGLESADIVFEEIVEGGITRFLAVYHCASASKAGPVRSARFDDPKLALPFTEVLAFSGANAIVEAELTAQGLSVVDEDTPGGALYRDPPGSLDVHSLFADVDALLSIARKAKGSPPAPETFTFDDIEGKARKARTVTVNFSASNSITYKWEGHSWKRYQDGAPFMSSTGSQISTPNLVVMQVDVTNSTRITDVAGNPSPDIDLLNKGKVVLFRDGKAIKGTWAMKRPGDPPRFTGPGGAEMTFAEGPIWIELVPSPKGDVKGSFSFSKR